MPDAYRNRVRVGGSGFTILTYGGDAISFCQQVAEVSPTPVGPGMVAIHPIDEPYPVQVITPAASNMGSLTLNMYELYNEKVWERLAADVGSPSNPFGGTGSNDVTTAGGIFDGAVDLVDVFIRQAEYDKPLNVVKFIRPPMLAGVHGKPYAEQYHGCVITNIQDGETIEVGSMEIIKQITIAYRYKTRNGKRSKAFAYRDRPLA